MATDAAIQTLKRRLVDARVFLTFDDGPSAEWTPQVLDVLLVHNARATFFVVGCRALKHAALLRRIAAAGHEIGNHTFSHRHPWSLSGIAARREVRAGSQAVSDVIGRQPKWFRPPHGRLRRCMAEEAAGIDQTTALWSISAIDWGWLATTDGISRRLDRVGVGDIVLMHDAVGKRNRPDKLLAVLPKFLSTLSRRELRSVTLSQDAE